MIKTYDNFKGNEYLYHTPYIAFVDNILDSNYLKSSLTSENGCSRDFKCVSLSRSSEMFYDDQPIRFKLNRYTLEIDYKLESYIDPLFNKEDLEEEEVVRKDIKPLHKYLTSIQFDPSQHYEEGDIEMIYRSLNTYIDTYNTLFEIKIDNMFLKSHFKDILKYLK